MMRFVKATPSGILFILVIASIALGPMASAQNFVEVKKKVVRKAIKDGSIRSVKVIAPETFNPGRWVDYEVALELDEGWVKGDDYNNLIHKSVVVTTSGGQEGEKGKIYVNTPTEFYPPKNLEIKAAYGIYEDTKIMSPDYCYKEFVYMLQGANQNPTSFGGGLLAALASANTRGHGGDGKTGEDAPDMDVKIYEDNLYGEVHIMIVVNNKPMLVKPGCGTIKIISKGADGTPGQSGANGVNGKKNKDKKFITNGGAGYNGGNGGRGGNGGNITVSGESLNKYRNMIEFISMGGQGGAAGAGGRGGAGVKAGKSGASGVAGNNGQPGQVIFQ